ARPPWEAYCARLYPHAGATTELAEMANHDHGGDELAVRGGARPSGEARRTTCSDLNLYAWCAHARLPREEKEDCRARQGSPSSGHGHFIAAKVVMRRIEAVGMIAGPGYELDNESLLDHL
ncbi:hypothetical protein Dimus_018346, partial [Dionaea muscipula]